MDVYANEEGSSAGPGKKRGLSKSSDSIYENVSIRTLEPKRSGPSLSGAEDVRRTSCRGAAVCLGLLSLLLLTGLITVVCLFKKGASEWKMEMFLLQNSYSNLTKERDQLQQADMARRELQRELQDEYLRQGWVNFSGGLYYISSVQKSWQESRIDCLLRCADLVIINSKEEQEFIYRFKKKVWIGLTDQETEGTWKWVDGTPLTESYWSLSEPNGNHPRDEDCTEITYYNVLNSWNDLLCDHKIYWICEKHIGSMTDH